MSVSHVSTVVRNVVAVVTVIVIHAVAVIVVVVLAVIGIFNALQRARIAAEGSFSNIDVELRRRHDLIPNLVEAAKGYLTHERGTLEAVIAARNAAAKGDAPGAAGEAQLKLALDNLLALGDG